MATSVEEHFEERPRKPNRLLFLLGGLALLALIVFFAIWTLPHTRPEFVGDWIGQKDSQAYMEFHADGTYKSRLHMDHYNASLNVWIAAEGTWKASHDALYLTPKSMRPDSQVKDRVTMQEIIDQTVGQNLKLKVNWQSPTQWFLDEYSDNPFVRKR